MVYRRLAMVLSVFAVLGLAGVSAQAGDGFDHHIVIHVDENDVQKMNIVLNNAANVTKHFQAEGKKVQVEIVVHGPGLHMVRSDTSPVKARIEDFFGSFPDVSFAACNNTIKGMTIKEGAAPPLIESDSIRVVPAGVVQIMLRQDQGWHYIRP